MIHAFPEFRFDYLFRNPTHYYDSYFSTSQRFLLFNGRSALFNGLALLSRDKRTEVLVPIFNCGNEIETVVSVGCRPVFYRIDENFNPDLNHLEELINDKTLALLFVYYNGFLQPTSELTSMCKRFGIALIEDCAHVLLPDRNTTSKGLLGDMAIFSPRKFFPITNGGVLLVNNPSLVVKELDCIKQDWPVIATEILSFTKRWLTKNKLRLVTSSYSEPGYEESIIEKELAHHDFHEDNYRLLMSWLSTFLLLKFDCQEIYSIRRRNYQLLFEETQHFPRFKCLMGPLSDDTCPWFFLAKVQEPHNIHHFLLQKRIESIVFWSYFHKNFPFNLQPEIEHLKKHLIALPVHQDITPEDTGYISDCLDDYIGSNQ